MSKIKQFLGLNLKFWPYRHLKYHIFQNLGVTSKKNNSIFKDIIQTKVDHPPSYPNFDKLFFDKFLVGRAPTLPTEFLTKDSKENSILSIFMHEI